MRTARMPRRFPDPGASWHAMRQIWWLVGKQKLFLHADAARYPISGCCQYVRFSSSNSNGPMANGLYLFVTVIRFSDRTGTSFERQLTG